MRLFVPVVGTALRVLNDVKVSVKYASQNNKFIKAFEELNNLAVMKSRRTDIILPKGLELTVDRVYVRQGDGAEYNSLTFKTPGDKHAGIPKGRFFLSVDTVNTLDVEVVEGKPSEDVPLKKLIAKRWHSHSYNNRVPEYTILEQIMGDTQALASGRIYLNLVEEVERHQAALAARLNKFDFASLEAARAKIEGAYSEDIADQMLADLTWIRRELLDKTQVLAVEFEAFAVNGELVLKLHNRLYTHQEHYCKLLSQLYHLMLCVSYAVSGDNRTRFTLASGYRALVCDKHDAFVSVGPRFGMNSEYGVAIYRKPDDDAVALLLGKDFSKSVFMHTKDSALYPFSYELEGEACALPALRREFNKRLKSPQG